MNKKFLFSLFAMLFVGLLLGYGLNFGLSANGRVSELSAKDKSSSIPRFDHKTVFPQTAEMSVDKAKEVSLSKKDSYFLQLSKMNVEEIHAEVGRILKKANYFRRSPLDELALFFLYSRLGEKAPRQALAKIKNTEEYVFYNRYIMNSWAQRNPEAAMNYCLENKDTEQVGDYATVIARISPEKAVDWIKALPQERKKEAVHGFVSGAFKSYPEKIGEIIQQTKELVSVDSYLTASIAGQWVKVDNKAAIAWIDTLPEEQQIKARASAVNALPLEDATRALATLEGKAKEMAISQIANSLAYDHPVQAMEWLIPHLDADVDNMENIIDKANFITGHFNNPDLQAYIAKMPSGEKKDIFMEKMVNTLAYSTDNLMETDMNQVISFASQISNPEKRTSSTEATLRMWSHRAPDKARQWIEKSDLSQEKKKEFYNDCDIREKQMNDLFE